MSITFSLPKTRIRDKFILSHRELLIVFCAVLAIAVRLIFPAKLAGEWFWINLALFFVFPLITIKYLLKENPRSFGLTAGKRNTGLGLATLVSAIFITANYLLIAKTGLRGEFSIFLPAAKNFWIFLWFSLLVYGVVFFSREFFFRGFLQMGLEKMIGLWAIPAQAILYSVLFIGSGWFTAGLAFLTALFAGWAVKMSRSIYYSFAALWIISIATDIMVIKLVLRQAI